MKRFWDKVDRSGDCWEWTASKDSHGYGRIKIGGKFIIASRFAFGLDNIPEGMCVCHRCDNPGCCRPSHLFIASHVDNMIDMSIKGRAPRGERCGAAKLCELDVLLIRDIDSAQQKIADWFGVGQTQISRIKRKEQWGHL